MMAILCIRGGLYRDAAFGVRPVFTPDLKVGPTSAITFYYVRHYLLRARVSSALIGRGAPDPNVRATCATHRSRVGPTFRSGARLRQGSQPWAPDPASSSNDDVRGEGGDQAEHGWREPVDPRGADAELDGDDHDHAADDRGERGGRTWPLSEEAGK